MKIIGYITAIIVAITLSAILNGYALSILWGWFIVPLFNLPTLNISYAIGLALTVSYLTKDFSADSNPSETFNQKLARGCVVAVLKPTLALLGGWIVTLFIH